MAAPKKIKTQPPATLQNFPIVGIGASAGGLDAFKRLLTVIPENSGMAYVLVQHLDPSHESFLPEILQRVTKIPVHEVTEDIHLAPDHIYIIPSNKILTSVDGVLQLAPRDKNILNLSIDIFFTSLAEVHKEFAVGIILSGTGKDGTEGLKAIKEYGGISIAQDMKSAIYSSMPESAINAGVVDFILAPEEIPKQLLQINSADKTSLVLDKERQEIKNDEDVFRKILSLLRQRSGVDFTYYKDPTLRRRIARRIAIVKKKNLANYLNFLRTDIAEQDALFQDMLIPVTSFFRDPKTFQSLTETVFPSILKNKNPDAPIRMWIAGCSTGEEVYSIAICLQEFLGANPNSFRNNTKIQIFGSDISEKAIKKARLGIYTKANLEMLSASQLENYFTKNNGGYEVSKLIRDSCVIAPHNFLKDPPFAKMDLISCRNVLIYMDPFLQKNAFATFHYALKESGFLLLGKSETIGASSDLFTQVAKNEKIYSRKQVPDRFRHVATELKQNEFTTKAKTVTKHEAAQTDFQKSAEAIMISKSPASVVVNEQFDIVHIYGDITPFLQAPQGKPTHNLLRMAREGLGFELRNAIHKASKEKTAVTAENIPIKIKDQQNGEVGQEQQSLVTMEVIPLTETVERHYLIRFQKIMIPNEEKERLASSGKTKVNKAEKRYEQLEKELAYIREDMRAITQDMEAANEELQSANEELQSSNEEMQSLNEELETSKEELQSTNEELIIVNQELLEKQEQLSTARLYSDSIVSTIRHPLIVLDKDLLIKTANAAFYKKFNMDEKETENKWFYEIQHRQFDDFKLRSLLIKVLSQKSRISDFEIVLNLPLLGERTLLMNAKQIDNEKKAEQLILLAIEDVTDIKSAQRKIAESENRFKLAIKASGQTAFSQDKNLKHTWVYNSLPDFNVEDILGKDDTQLHESETAKRLTVLKKGVLQTGIGIRSDVLMTTNGEDSFHEIIIEPIKDDQDKVVGIAGVTINITEKVRAKKQIEASAKEQKKLMQNLKLATDSANVGIWTLNIISSKLEWSKIHKKLWGYDENREEFTYEDWHNLILPEDKKLVFQRLEESKANRDIYEVDYRIRRANDDAIVWIRSTGQYQFDESGEAYTLSGISVDITEQKYFTEELEIKVKERTTSLNKSNEELKQSNIQLDQFAHIASHDLQEPLRKILTFSMRLQDNHKDELSTEVRSYLNKIEGASSRMTTLIKDLLNYSRLLQYEKSFSKINLNITIDNLLTDFELLIEEKKAKIEVAQLPTLEAIPFQMNQLFHNLIGNSLKFSKEGIPPVIKINSRKISEKEIEKYLSLIPTNQYVEITFQDNGIGFEQKYAEQIFTIFQRLHNRENYSGTGIGLALCKKIIGNHDGEIFANSKEDQGAIFHIILPLKKLY